MPWKLSIFALLQLLALVGSVVLWPVQPVLAIGSFLLAAIFMCFDIHIFMHECVHHRKNCSPLFNSIASLFIGLPFDGYRLHHYNHHAFENGAADFSTTWKYTGEQRRPYGLLEYSLGWVRQLSRSLNCQQPYPDDALAIRTIKARAHTQKYILMLCLLALLLVSRELFALYLAHVYFGWVFTAMQNYGQHPPGEGADIQTYNHPFYNKLFFNNGLHWEHHHNPGLPWHKLQADEHSQRIDTIHLLNPIFKHRS